MSINKSIEDAQEAKNYFNYYIKDLGKIFNKVIGQIGQDMEMVDSRMNKLTKRFNEYTKKSSTCCLCVFFWCDAIVFGLLVWIYTCVNESGWHC